MDEKKVVRLMPHQKEAVEKLRSGCILCGGTGTGKSITSLAYYYIKVCDGIVWNDGQLGPMLNPIQLYIITTAQKRDKHEWEDEIDRFDMGQISVVVDSWNNIEKYDDEYDAFFIFDEQRIGGHGKWANTFVKIARNNRWILLSATPGDTWEDYWSVFVANGFYKSRWEYLNRHAIFHPFITKYRKITGWRETGFLEFLRRKITVLMDYEKQTVPHWVDIPVEYDKKLYDVVVKDRRDPWTEEPLKDISGVCAMMRRVVNKHFTRLNALMDILWEKDRAIVFYNFDYELEMIQEHLTKFEFPFAEWNGHKHEPVPTGETWAYLVQYAAGAEGWNCVSTDTVIFYSMSYSYKATQQAAGRIDRLNTPYVDLYYYTFKSEANIDKAIEKALSDKRDFNEVMFWDKEM